MGYLRRWWRVRRSIFLCFFLRMRLRRFLINEPIRLGTLAPDRIASNLHRKLRNAHDPPGTAGRPRTAPKDVLLSGMVPILWGIPSGVVQW